MTTRTAITAGQVDSGSPVDEALMSTSIRNNDLNHEERLIVVEAATVSGASGGLDPSRKR